MPSMDVASMEPAAGSVLADPIQTATGRAWWAAHRRSYNIILIVAGAAVFALYLVLLNRCDPTRTIGSLLERNRVQIVTYVAAIAVANVVYSLGPILESAVPPSVRSWYRRLAFTGGALFSAALPFYVPFELFTRGCTR